MKYFGTDGIRGIPNKTLKNDLVYKLGRALKIFNIKDVYVATDTRESKDMLTCSLFSGCMSVGLNVHYLGILPTPGLMYYSKIKKVISKDDVNLQKAIKHGEGIRILNQDPWEMLISFIISAANNIPRISKTIENISKTYGKEIIFRGEKYYLFPTPEELSKASIEDLRTLNLGFRDKYVYGATQMVCNGEIDLDAIVKMDYIDAKKELKKIAGVGDKVADCILLFSMKKYEAFPVDTWIKKVMSELYNESKDIKKISLFAEEKFGKNAGIAQQYLFYYMRENY